MDEHDDVDKYLNFLADTLNNDDFATHFPWPSPTLDVDFSLSDKISPEQDCAEEHECVRKRIRNDAGSNPVTKACREKLRREKLNERFLELSSVLEPGRPTKTDKPSIIDDAIKTLTYLRTEAQDLKETNEKLLEEIKSLKAEKNEFREEKLVLKAENEKMERQLKSMVVPPHSGYFPAHPAAAYHGGGNKMPFFPSYNYNMVPMWQYLPQSAYDTSQDHQLRPPAA